MRAEPSKPRRRGVCIGPREKLDHTPRLRGSAAAQRANGDLLHQIAGMNFPRHHDASIDPRRLKARPVGELTNFVASTPKRATNLPQPVCGGAVTSTTAVPIASRVPGGEIGSHSDPDRRTADRRRAPSARVSGDERDGAGIHDVDLHLGMRDRSGMRELGRSFHVSPAAPRRGPIRLRPASRAHR